jgi:hypothetical protein
MSSSTGTNVLGWRAPPSPPRPVSCTTVRPGTASSTGSGAAQQARISVPVSATRRGSSPHIPSPFATPRRKWRQLAHEVVERRHTQQRAASACGVEQWGQRQTGMRGS